MLFQLPVTKTWLRQFALSLTLICHSSYRGVVEFCLDLLDVHLSVGWVHNIVHAAIDKARPYNIEANLAKVAYAGPDQIYQHRQPVFVAADIESTYCLLLSSEDHCDGDPWALRLLEAQDRGLAPQAFVSDFGAAIHAGRKLAMPDILHRGDVFHGLAEITEAVTFLEKRAYHLVSLAVRFEVSATVVRDMLDLALLDNHQPKGWQKEALLRHQLRDRFYPLQKAVHDLAKHVVRARSVIENINCR